jgi:hypothetical protein
LSLRARQTALVGPPSVPLMDLEEWAPELFADEEGSGT